MKQTCSSRIRCRRIVVEFSSRAGNDGKSGISGNADLLVYQEVSSKPLRVAHLTKALLKTFTAITRVRIPLGTPIKSKELLSQFLFFFPDSEQIPDYFVQSQLLTPVCRVTYDLSSIKICTLQAARLLLAPLLSTFARLTGKAERTVGRAAPEIS